MQKKYAKAYEELCRRCKCAEHERLAIEKGTFDIIKCSYDDVYTGYICRTIDMDCITSCSKHNEVHFPCGFEKSKHIKNVKRIVESVLDEGKISDLVIVNVSKNCTSTSSEMIVKKNETLESLAISYDLNCIK